MPVYMYIFVYMWYLCMFVCVRVYEVCVCIGVTLQNVLNLNAP